MLLKRSLKPYQPVKPLGFYKVLFFCSHDVSPNEMSSEDVCEMFLNSSDLVASLVLSH